MATITSAQTGNFSSTSTWVGGVVPTSADDAVAATGHIITIDSNVTVLSFQQAGTGKFLLPGERTITGGVVANAGTFTSGGTIEVTATTGTTAVINGNITGVSTTAANTAGVVMTGTGTLTINGSVTGSAGNASTGANGSAAVYTNVTNTININGNVSAGSGNDKRGCQSDASSNTAWTIIGNLTGGPGNTNGIGAAIYLQGATASVVVTGNITVNIGDSRGIHHSGSNGTITLVGNITTSSTNRSYGILASGSTPTIVVTGNIFITGNQNTAAGIAMTTSASFGSLTFTGDITNTANAGGGGVGITANATSAPVVNMVGTVRAGTQGIGHGIECAATTANSGVIFQGNMIDSATGVKAIWTRIFRLTATNSGYTQYQNNVNYPLGSPVYRVSPDNVTGMPAASNVRKNTVYGYSNQLTGTCAIPPASAVTAGAAVDNTTGTAVLTTGDVAALIGAQIAAATTSPVGI